MIKHILKGIKSYGKAFYLVSKLKLWRYLIIPILLAIFILSIVIIPLWSIYAITKGFLGYWHFDKANNILFEIAHYVEITLFFIIGKILYKHIAMAILSPIMSPISLKIENYLYDDTHEHIKVSFMKSLSRGIKINTRNFIREMLSTLVLLSFTLIPYIGVFAALLIFIINAYYTGFGNMDPTLERHFNYKDSISFVKKNKGIAIGNGIIFLICLFIPVIGIIIVYPISFIAASVATLEALNMTKIKD